MILPFCGRGCTLVVEKKAAPDAQTAAADTERKLLFTEASARSGSGHGARIGVERAELSQQPQQHVMQSGGRGAQGLSAAGGATTLASVEAMKVSELRSRLQAAGHSTDGKKADLVARLMGHVAAQQRSPGASQSPRHKRKRPLEEPDAGLVNEVRVYMKANKLSQVMVGQEARVSQAVISQWLSLKYHGHNAKVDSAMREWLNARRSGRVCMPNPDEPTSVLRPSRSTTFAEKRSKEKRRKDMMTMAAAEATGALGPGALCQLLQLREAAAAAEASDGTTGGAPDADGLDRECSVEMQDRKRAPNGVHTDRRAKAIQPPERSGLVPKLEVGEDVFGLAELAAQTMCELESSPAKPRRSSLRSPDLEEDPRRNEIPAALLKPTDQAPGPGAPDSVSGLTWDRAYSYSVGLEQTRSAPAGVRVRLDHIREAYMHDLNYWPSDAAAQHLVADGGRDSDPSTNDTASGSLGNRLLRYADFATFSLEAAKSENHTKPPADYTMSDVKQRSHAAASHAHDLKDADGLDNPQHKPNGAAATARSVNRCYSSELGPSAIAADNAAKPAPETDEGSASDDNTRRHSPPIRCGALLRCAGCALCTVHCTLCAVGYSTCAAC